MKKNILTLFALLMLSISGYTQGLYFRVGAGYAIPQAGQSMNIGNMPYNGSLSTNGNIDGYKLKTASYSAGFNGALALGYLFGDHIGVQLDVEAGIAPKKNTFNGTNINVVYTNSITILSNITITTQAALPVLLTPAIVLQTGGKKVNVYSRFGPAIPLRSKIRQEDVYQNVPGTGSPSVNHYTYDIKNSFSLGLSAALGMQFKLNKRMNFWTEVSLLSMSLYIKQRDLIAYEHNGRSYSISSLTGVTTQYYNKNGVQDPNRVNNPAYSQPFSSVGMNVGIRMSLGSRNMRDPANKESDHRDMSNRPKSGKFR